MDNSLGDNYTAVFRLISCFFAFKASLKHEQSMTSNPSILPVSFGCDVLAFQCFDLQL